MALATERFSSRLNFLHIQNLHSKIYFKQPQHNFGWFGQKKALKFASILSLVARKSLLCIDHPGIEG